MHGNIQLRPADRVDSATFVDTFNEAYRNYFRPLNLTRKEVEEFYLGYSNKCLWPLFHYFQEHCEFNRDHWKTYKEVNPSIAVACCMS